MIALDKLTAREMYSVLLLLSGNTPTSQKYFGKVFPNENFDWKKIDILARVVNINSFQRNFQNKILHNIISFYLWQNKNTSMRSFYHSYGETIKHVFLECICVKQLWNYLKLFLTNDISLPILTLQTAIFGFINRTEGNVSKVKKYILLIFELLVYKSRERGSLELSRLIYEIKKVKLLDKNSVQTYFRKLERSIINWRKLLGQ